jgi:[acyl-carrier-protein] S-malonyltransferase
MGTTGLLFSGQGAQQVGMGKSLCEAFPSVSALYAQANDILGWDLRQISFAGDEHHLTETRVCQPALFVHGIAVATVLREKGRLDNCQVALGLSLGEVTALTAAGVFDFATGLRVVAERGRLMQVACETTEGGMASVIGASRDEVEALCQDFDIDMANLNCPGQIVISGEKSKVAAAVAAGRERGLKRVIPLKVAGAYHSRLMEPARADFALYLRDIPCQAPQMTVLSNTTGRPVRTPDEIRKALIAQVVSPVLWEDCLRQAGSLGIDRFFECGPGSILSGLARRTDPTMQVVGIAEAEDLEKVALSDN